MSFATRLLRILLILALTTSGPGMAAPQIAVPIASSHVAATDRACHEHAGMANAPSGESDARGSARHPERCGSSDCHCACAHLTQAMSPACALPVVAAQRTLAIPSFGRRHPDAARAHLIRPPIG